MENQVVRIRVRGAGKRSSRLILPSSIAFGSTPESPEEQWLLRGLDVEARSVVEIALKDVLVWGEEDDAERRVSEDEFAVLTDTAMHLVREHFGSQVASIESAVRVDPDLGDESVHVKVYIHTTRERYLEERRAFLEFLRQRLGDHGAPKLQISVLRQA